MFEVITVVVKGCRWSYGVVLMLLMGCGWSYSALLGLVMLKYCSRRLLEVIGVSRIFLEVIRVTVVMRGSG